MYQTTEEDEVSYYATADANIALNQIPELLEKFWPEYMKRLRSAYNDNIRELEEGGADQEDLAELAKGPPCYTVEVWPGRLIFIDNREKDDFWERDEMITVTLDIPALESAYESGEFDGADPDERDVALNNFVVAAIKSAWDKLGPEVWREFEERPVLVAAFSKDQLAVGVNFTYQG